MGKYPEVITPQEVEKQSHVSRATIHGDIADTLAEIRQLEEMEKAEATLARVHLDHNQRKIYELKSDARPREIQQRREFVAYLKRLLLARGEPALSVVEWDALPEASWRAPEPVEVGRMWRVNSSKQGGWLLGIYVATATGIETKYLPRAEVVLT